MARFKEIASHIRHLIEQGDYPENSPLPRQADLAKTYQTSRMTIQKALELLRYEGLITSRQGSGSVVRQDARNLAKVDGRIDEYNGLTANNRGIAEVSSKILHFDVRFPTNEEQANLQISDYQPVYDIARLRFVDHEPHVLEYTIMPIHVIPNLKEETLQQSIYDYIENSLQLTIGVATRRIRADKPSATDQAELNCTAADPILEIEQVVYLDDGVPFEFSRSRNRYDNGDILVVNMNRTRKTLD